MPITSPLAAPHPGVRSSPTTYYMPVTMIPSSGTVAAVANSLIFAPFYLPNSTIDRIALEVTTGAAGLCRVGLYTNSNGLPASLIVDAGALDTTNAGIIEATISPVTLTDGWVWAAMNFNAAPTMRSASGTGQFYVGAASLQAATKGVSQTLTYGALPATAAPVFMSTGMPTIALRKS